jgi:hypothetical protein
MSFPRNPLVPLVLLAALSGCSTTPRFNNHFGDALRADLAAQVLDPAAAANVRPAAGIDGVAAHAAQQRYERSFAETPVDKAPLVKDR